MSVRDGRGGESPVAPPAVLPWRETRLANGLEVIVLENPVVPLVTIEIDVRNGAYTETAEYDGLSHLYEHMFFKANERIPDQERYLRRTRELGMEWNGTTSEERVNYYFTLHSRRLVEGLEFMNDAIRTPLFLPEELEREREVVIGEYDRAESDPGFHLHVAVAKRLWPVHYTRKNVIGTREVILGATPGKMFHIRNRFYIPNNSALLITGDVEAATAFELAARVFGGWAPGADPFAADPVPHHPPLERSSTVVVEKPVGAVTAVLAWHGPSVELDPSATWAADVLTFILGQRNSRFYRRLVDSGLATSAALHYQTLRFTGPLQAHMVATPENADAAYAALVAEIDALDEPDAFTDEELENAKRQIEIDQVYESERPSQLVHTLGYWWAVAGLDYYRNYVQALRGVQREDVHAFARRYLIGKPRITGVLVSAAARPQLGEWAREAD